MHQGIWLVILKWLTQFKSQCPHCRADIDAKKLVSGRFIDEIMQKLHTLSTDSCTGSLWKHDPSNCPLHDLPYLYYCSACSDTLCSDCAFMGDKVASFQLKHKTHELEKLQDVVDRSKQKMQKIAVKVAATKKNIEESVNLLDSHLSVLEKKKKSYLQEISQLEEYLRSELESSYAEKLVCLNSRCSTN
jgi:hypothetical protein